MNGFAVPRLGYLLNLHTMKQAATYLSLTSLKESLSLEMSGSRFFIRRLSLGELALIEKRLLKPGPRRPGQKPAMVMPPRSLEAAVVECCLTGWENLVDYKGERIDFSKEAARRLPAKVAGRIANKALRLN